MSTIRSIAPAICVGLSIIAPPALAQVGETAPFSVNQAADTSAVRPTISASIAPASGLPLAQLPAATADLTFVGETGTRTLPFFVGPTNSGGAATLMLTLRSAISDDPDNSHLAVAINGQPLAPVALAGGDARTLQLPVSAGLLQPGYNALSLTVDQSHRVDCSIPATFELWTAIDTSRSGFLYSSNGSPSADWSSVLAVVGADQGRTDIRARVSPDLPDAQRNAIMKFAQAVTISAGISQPKIEFNTAPGAGAGIDLLVGSPESFGGQLDPADAARLQPGINILPASPDGRATIAVVDTPDHLNADLTSLSQLAAQNATVGTAAGLAAKAQAAGEGADQDGRLVLAGLGVDQRVFHGRHFLQTLNFTLPPDFYPADYGKAGLGLSAYYMPELAKGAQLLVGLNGQTAATVLLSGSRTGEIRDQLLPLALSNFRPGRNSLTIEAFLPAANDSACVPGHVADATGRLQINGSSYLQLPGIAQVGRFPDIAALGSDITGSGSDSGTLDIVLAGDGPAPLDAAATLVAKIAAAGGHILDVHFKSAGSIGTNPTLIVGAFDALPADVAKQLNLNLTGGLGAVGGANAAGQTLGGNPLAGATASTADSGFLQTAGSSVGRSFLRIRAAFRGLANSWGWNAGALGLGSSATYVLPRDTALLVAQRPGPASNLPITLVAASDQAQLQSQIDNLVGEPMWSRLIGSTTAFDGKGAMLQTVPSVSARLFPTQPFSLGNGRLVVAGWLSNNAEIYALLVILAAGLVGIATSLVLVATRGLKR